MISLPTTNLTEHLIRENDLGERGLAQWAFAPGMAFGSTVQWWGDGGRRERPHEGVDLCLYYDRQGDLCRLCEGARLPAMYGGTVVRLCDDFLGRSVMIERGLPKPGRPGPGTLYAMYGHTVPRPDLEVGQKVEQGEVLAFLAPLPAHKTGILPHLHVSLGWAPGPVAYDRLDWERIPDLVTLLDPAQALDRPVQMLERTWSVPALRALVSPPVVGVSIEERRRRAIAAAGRFRGDKIDTSTNHDEYLAEA